MSGILIAPVITEKTMYKVADGKYTFKVSAKAGKVQIAKAVEDLFKVKVTKVNVATKKRENILLKGKYHASKKGWKKAVVTLKSGQKIPGFEEK